MLFDEYEACAGGGALAKYTRRASDGEKKRCEKCEKCIHSFLFLIQVNVCVCVLYIFHESGYYPHGHATTGDLTAIISPLFCKLFQLKRDFPSVNILLHFSGSHIFYAFYFFLFLYRAVVFCLSFRCERNVQQIIILVSE